MPDDSRLIAVLAQIQRRGGIGTQSVPEAIEHADRFSRLVPAAARSAADLGSGGGLPALVVAVRHPTLVVHLIERRATRADLLRFGVTALELDDRVHVHAKDVRDVVESGLKVDVVTARSFSTPRATVAMAAELLAPSGWVLVSAAPGTHVLDIGDPADLDLVDHGVVHGVAQFQRVPRGTCASATA